MRIGLNLMYLVPGEVGGTETYARELILELARLRPHDEFIVFCGEEAAAVLPDPRWPKNVRVHGINVRCRNKPRRVATEMLRLPRIARREGIELLHSLGVTSPLFGRFARVVSIHDLIFHHFPETFPGPARKGLEFLVPRGARRADRVITISHASARDLVETYGISRTKIDVTPLAGLPVGKQATSVADLRLRLALGNGPYLLCVASTIAHKNIARLLEAFNAATDEAMLVIAGHPGLQQTELEDRIAELELGERVKFTGWIGPEDLEGLYSGALGFVYPTLIEGFGMPVLEAMQRGVPVACSDLSSLPEVAGDAALTFDPLDVEAIAHALRELLENTALREKLKTDGIVRAAQFSWSTTAQRTWASYESALGSSPS